MYWYYWYAVPGGDSLHAGNFMPTFDTRVWLRFTLQALYRAHALLEGGQRHVTIADLTQGVVHPSKVRRGGGGGRFCSCL